MSRRAAPKANAPAVHGTEGIPVRRRAAAKAIGPVVVASRPAKEGVSQRARAYQGFTQQILSGGIRSGQFISQRELMTLLDMPLGAVREMIPRLEAGGLIKTVPQRGLQIAHVDLKLIRNAFQVRAMIEHEAVRHFVHSASDEELAQIASSHEDILQRATGSATHADDQLLDDAQAIDWGLHDRMVDALGNEIVSELYRVNSLRIRLIKLDSSVITPAQLIPAMREHQAFIAALCQRDAAAATELLDAHIRSARDRVLAVPLEPVLTEPASSVSVERKARPANTIRRKTS